MPLRSDASPGGDVVKCGAGPLDGATEVFGVDRSELDPVCPPPVVARSSTSTTVSSSPPMRETMGTVPYLNAQSWRQAARLEPRRYDQRIRAGLNQMGQTFVMPDHDAHLFRVGLCGGTITILQAAISSAPQHDQLHSFAYDRREIFEQKIDPLLAGQPADDAEHERIGRNLQAEPPLQGRLVDRAIVQDLRFETTRHIRIKTAGDVRVCRRIPHRNIDAVEDSAEVA